MSVETRRLSQTFRFPRQLRLIKSEDFSKILTAPRDTTLRVHSHHFTATVMLRSREQGPLRIGITVGKKNAHRSVDRALVKRTLRETARHQAPYLIALLCDTGVGLDVSLRLKKALSTIPGTDTGVRALKQALREDAQELMTRLQARLESVNSRKRDF